MPKQANNPNWLCGRPLVFGDPEQIAEYERLSQEHEYLEKFQASTPSTCIECPECKAEIDLEQELFPELFS